VLIVRKRQTNSKTHPNDACPAGKTSMHINQATSPSTTPLGNLKNMKSAYELAMERLEAQSPTRKLSAEQIAEIAEIESLTQAKLAEKDLFLKDQITKASANNDFESVQQLQDQLQRELRRIRDDSEEKKEAVRNR
jgi:hypothetical protein